MTPTRFSMIRSRRLVACTLLLALSVPAFGQQQPPPAQPNPPPNAPGPAAKKSFDPSLFDPQNQKECDYPSACGCNCKDTPPAKGTR